MQIAGVLPGESSDDYSVSFADRLASGAWEAAEIVRALAIKLGCTWSELDARASRMSSGSPPPHGSLLVADARLVLERGTGLARLKEMLPHVPGAVLIDPDGGMEIGAIGSLVQIAEAAGLRVEHRSLVRSPNPGTYGRESPLVVVSDGHDRRIEHLLAAGARGLALDPSVTLEGTLDRPARVCVASYEVAGPTRNGGIGTANTSLALALASAGHDVTLLFTGLGSEVGAVDARAWQRHYAGEKVRFEMLGDGTASTVLTPHPNARRAYELYAWLLEHDRHEPFDIVHVPDGHGHGYYAQRARRQELAFADTLFAVGVHSPTRWCAEANRELPRSIDALVDEHLERVSVELADVLISPSAYMLDYMQERGWKLPERRFVQQYILPPLARSRPGRQPGNRDRPIDEIVFFGRLEVRKGVETFCDALDLLADGDAPRDLQVTFLGRPEHIRGEPSTEYLARRATRWPWRYEVRGELEPPAAMAYLRRDGCLAVMPSTVDNSPNTVSEALSLGVPMITSRSGGTGELIDPIDLADVTFPGLESARGLPPVPADQSVPEISPAALAERIHGALRSPVVPRFAIDHEANERIHVGWNVGAVAAKIARERSRGRKAAATESPTVTVGILDRGPGDELTAALTALSEQRQQALDVIVIDGRAHRHVAGAREQMMARGRGELFVFLRASESLAPRALERIRQIASRTRAEVLTWPSSDPDGSVVVPIGGPALAGMLYPAFCSGPYAITRSALERLGGFTDDACDLDADQDLLNRAALAGLSIEVIPEPLSVLQAADAWATVRRAPTIELGDHLLDREQAIRISRPFAALAPAQLSDLAGLQLMLRSDAAAERSRALVAYKELADQRHQQAEYIAYLEDEHHKLAASLAAALREAAERGPYRRARRALGRIKRRWLA